MCASVPSNYGHDCLKESKEADILRALVVLNVLFASPFDMATENESIANAKAINSVVMSIRFHFWNGVVCE